MIPIGPKRTNVKIILINSWPEDDFLEPGTALHKYNNHLSFACPGCGKFGSIPCDFKKPPNSPSWEITSGSLDDLNNLSLKPSINCTGCCGWHGFLTNGIFVSC